MPEGIVILICTPMEEIMIKRMFAALLCTLLFFGCASAMAQEAEVNTQVKHYLLLGQDGYAEIGRAHV